MMKAARVAGTSPNHAPTVASSVLHHDIAGRQGHLGAIVELEYHVAGEKDPEIRRVRRVHAGFVALLDVYPGSGFWCSNRFEPRRVRRDDEAMPPTGGNRAGAAGLSPEFG
jgi:hypothetical protein